MCSTMYYWFKQHKKLNIFRLPSCFHSEDPVSFSLNQKQMLDMIEWFLSLASKHQGYVSMRNHCGVNISSFYGWVWGCQPGARHWDSLLPAAVFVRAVFPLPIAAAFALALAAKFAFLCAALTFRSRTSYNPFMAFVRGCNQLFKNAHWFFQLYQCFPELILRSARENLIDNQHVRHVSQRCSVGENRDLNVATVGAAAAGSARCCMLRPQSVNVCNWPMGRTSRENREWKTLSI